MKMVAVQVSSENFVCEVCPDHWKPSPGHTPLVIVSWREARGSFNVTFQVYLVLELGDV